MNLIYGEIIEIVTENDNPMGKIRVGGVFKTMPLMLLEEPRIGDTVLVCDGIPIGKVKHEEQKESKHVSGHSRKSDGNRRS